jgi:CubicO group peptidase (beta-lactamase class C family)
MNLKLTLLVSLLFVAILSTFSCKKSNNTTNNQGTTAQVGFHITDAPANYDHVYLDIQQVEVTMSGSSAVTLSPTRPGLYDILQFRNGLDTLLLRASLPAGTISQIRLILGSGSYVVESGVSHPLNTPSAQESGVKLNLNQTFAAGGAYEVWIDFDAAKSIVVTGSGTYKLKPVIRAYSSVTMGRIKGYVLPLNAFATVYAVNGTDTAAAIPTTADGFFVINGLNAATYQLIVSPGVPVFQAYVQANVQVTYGTEVNIGSITLHP